LKPKRSNEIKIEEYVLQPQLLLLPFGFLVGEVSAEVSFSAESFSAEVSDLDLSEVEM